MFASASMGRHDQSFLLLILKMLLFDYIGFFRHEVCWDWIDLLLATAAVRWCSKILLQWELSEVVLAEARYSLSQNPSRGSECQIRQGRHIAVLETQPFRYP